MERQWRTPSYSTELVTMPELIGWVLLKSRKAGLGGDANAFQSPMILQLHTATLKEIYQRGKGFTTIAGARRNNADQLTQRILPRVDFSIRIFHGHFRNKNVLWLDVTTRRFVQKFS